MTSVAASQPRLELAMAMAAHPCAVYDSGRVRPSVMSGGAMPQCPRRTDPRYPRELESADGPGAEVFIFH
jgi:hypothetical protein